MAGRYTIKERLLIMSTNPLKQSTDTTIGVTAIELFSQEVTIDTLELETDLPPSGAMAAT